MFVHLKQTIVLLTDPQSINKMNNHSKKCQVCGSSNNLPYSFCSLTCAEKLYCREFQIIKVNSR